MWTTSKSLNAHVRPRPARIAYLIPEKPSDTLLDVLIDECFSRWGGRRTPLIPTDGRTIVPAYWALLDLWDADIIYSYVKLADELEQRLYYMFAPSEIRLHDTPVDDADSRGLYPDYGGNFHFVSSLSLLPFFARRAQHAGSDLPQIADKEHWAVVDRDTADSFGLVSNSHPDHSLLPHARRLSLRPEHDANVAQRFKDDVAISYIDDADTFVETIASNRGILLLSRLSDMTCPYLRHLAHGHEGWDEHLTIVIGDDIADRLLFWNAQHRYRALDGLQDIPVLRLSPKRFENGAPDWLRHWISRRNHRHLNGNHAPQTFVRSCSLSEDELNTITDALNGPHVMISAVHHDNPDIFEICERWVRQNREGPMERLFPSIWTHPSENRPASVRFTDNTIELPFMLPWHIKDTPLSNITDGVWACDLTIERREDHARPGFRHHVWRFPRRLRLEQAIDIDRILPNLTLPPVHRPTETGDLTIWDCSRWERPILTIPSDFHAFGTALTRHPPASPQANKAAENNASDVRFDQIKVSDKGRDLLGVFQLFSSLPEALSFLTNPYWLEVIRRLSPEEPANKPRNVRALADSLRKMQHQAAGELDLEDLARRALALAARSFASQHEQLKHVDFDKLFEWANAGKGQDRGNVRRQRLADAVTYLRDRKFFWQGFGWTCSFCQHHNWVPLERLSDMAACEICRKPKSGPVEGSLHFRLSPFVHHAFSSASAQGPVAWCLDQLSRRASQSFGFTPTVDVYRLGKDTPETDFDVLASVDGEIYLAEVKSSFSGITDMTLKQLRHLAADLRPDVAMLAVQANKPNKPALAASMNQLCTDLAAYDVRFELLTLESSARSEGDDEITVPSGRLMLWST